MSLSIIIGMKSFRNLSDNKTKIYCFEKNICLSINQSTSTMQATTITITMSRIKKSQN